MNNHLNLITAQFPRYQDLIMNLYLSDDDFKTLCEDYLVSRTTLEKYNSKLMEDKNLEMEYRHLSIELEKELLEYLIKNINHIPGEQR